MRHKDYITYFRSIATAHLEVQHFSRMIPVDWPLRNVKLEQFISDERANMVFPTMLLETFIAKTRDFKGDQQDRHFDGAFLIIEKAARGDFDNEDQKIDDCERIADEIMGYIRHEMHQSVNEYSPTTGRRYFDVNSVTMEKVGVIARDLVGVRYNMTFKKSITWEYDETKFNWT